MRLFLVFVPALFATGHGNGAGLAIPRQASQANPCDTAPGSSNPCGTTTPFIDWSKAGAWASAGPATLPPTPVPTPSPATIATTPAPPPPLVVPKVCLNDMSLPPGTFKPWAVYKYLKVNTPFVDTPPKDIMGGQTVKFLNAGKPFLASNFTCVAEANEWKARVNSPLLNILTMERDDGMALPGIGNIVSRCLLQDISLFRSVSGTPALRLDYGNCPVGPVGVPGSPNMSTKQAFFLIGLKKVPDTTLVHPNVRGFFQDVCNTNTTMPGVNETIPPEQSLNLAAAHGSAGDTCFATSADMEDFVSLDDKCFPEGVAYEMLGYDNQWPVLPVPESDWNWFLSVLPIGDHPADDACATFGPKKMYGKVIMDRVCLEFEGIACNNHCGAWCQSVESQSATTTTTFAPIIPKAICIDCEWQEVLYALFATLAALQFSYYTWIAASQKGAPVWLYTALPGGAANPDAADYTPMITPKNAFNFSAVLQPGLLNWAALGIGLITFIWTVFWYYVINLFDTLITKIFSWEQCIRVWGFQYSFNEEYYLSKNGTLADYEAERYRDQFWKLFGVLPMPKPDIHIDVCYFRLWGMILVTWFSLWALMFWWRRNQKAPVKEVVMSERIIYPEEGGGVTLPQGGEVTTPIGGMFTAMVKPFV